MNHLGLFEGNGGFGLAARWMGWETIAWCEINPFCQTVLKYHFPNATGHIDIKETDFTIYKGRVDILTGGFPCQPYSQAGLRKGKEDERHLWPEMLRAIREVQPTWVVGENVLGIVNWSGGMVFDEVQADLEAEGYEVQPYVLPACAKDAPHRRDRVWFVAYSQNKDGRRSLRKTSEHSKPGINGKNEPITYSYEDKCKSGTSIDKQYRESATSYGSKHDVPDSTGERLAKSGQEYQQYPANEGQRIEHSSLQNYWRCFPTQSPLCNGNDGLSSRLDGITFSKWRAESIKAGGNAIVPQVAYEIFKAIDEYQSSLSSASKD